ncbi:MAG: hypothetical protein ACREFP_23640 [Acetobacteraceae bacterium]
MRRPALELTAYIDAHGRHGHDAHMRRPAPCAATETRRRTSTSRIPHRVSAEVPIAEATKAN